MRTEFDSAKECTKVELHPINSKNKMKIAINYGINSVYLKLNYTQSENSFSYLFEFLEIDRESQCGQSDTFQGKDDLHHIERSIRLSSASIQLHLVLPIKKQIPTMLISILEGQKKLQINK